MPAFPWVPWGARSHWFLCLSATPTSLLQSPCILLHFRKGILIWTWNQTRLSWYWRQEVEKPKETQQTKNHQGKWSGKQGVLHYCYEQGASLYQARPPTKMAQRLPCSICRTHPPPHHSQKLLFKMQIRSSHLSTWKHPLTF